MQVLDSCREIDCHIFMRGKCVVEKKGRRREVGKVREGFPGLAGWPSDRGR